ncbi:hypothetical protein, partial [Candidatus Electronema sp. JM]|uniref:hypothetical protein n=1 Tax=Candidatus Electronema sp. JM TaxID=3401571 RepID=UPI003AA9814E
MAVHEREAVEGLTTIDENKQKDNMLHFLLEALQAFCLSKNKLYYHRRGRKANECVFAGGKGRSIFCCGTPPRLVCFT